MAITSASRALATTVDPSRSSSYAPAPTVPQGCSTTSTQLAAAARRDRELNRGETLRRGVDRSKAGIAATLTFFLLPLGRCAPLLGNGEYPVDLCFGRFVDL